MIGMHCENQEKYHNNVINEGFPHFMLREFLWCFEEKQEGLSEVSAEIIKRTDQQSAQ